MKPTNSIDGLADRQNDVRVIKAQVDLISSFHACLDAVAREHIYIEMVEAPALEKAIVFQTGLIEADGPVFYAVHGAKVIGWCDVTRSSNPRMAHRGFLGMGLSKEFRGRGLGSRLMEQTLRQAKTIGLEKVELQVYSSNLAAIRLYERHGFEREGLIRSYRKVDGVTFDCVAMAKFL